MLYSEQSYLLCARPAGLRRAPQNKPHTPTNRLTVRSKTHMDAALALRLQQNAEATRAHNARHLNRLRVARPVSRMTAVLALRPLAATQRYPGYVAASLAASTHELLRSAAPGTLPLR